MRRTTRSAWDGARPASSIHDVWDFLSVQLRNLSGKLRNVDEDFYGDSSRIDFIGGAFSALKILTDSSTVEVSTLKNVNDVIAYTQRVETKRIKTARDEAVKLLNRIREVLPTLEELKKTLGQNVLRHLENYCYDYHKLGITDDTFYKQLRVRIVRMKELLGKFDQIAKGLRGDVVYSQYFCDDKFSEEIAITYDCETFPVLRACPDMLQKLYEASDIAQDWLRSDKVYVEEIEKQIEQTKVNIKEREDEYGLIKLEYSKIFCSLKQRQNESEYSEYADETIAEAKNTLSRLEASKYRIQVQMVAVSKLLLNCRDRLRMKGLRSTASPPPEGETNSRLDVVDGCNPDRLGLASSTYRDRVQRDSRTYSNKLQEMKHRLNRIHVKIRRKSDGLSKLESATAEVEQLTRKLKSVAKKKSNCNMELQVLKDHLRQLEKTLANRKYPSAQVRNRILSEEMDETDDLATSLDLDCSLSQINNPREDATLSADLRRAFRIVKNNIGFSWKDLARTLPYNPHKGLTEMNNDILAIEHENPGHLKEQAYQSLIRWYNHNGCRTSLRDLTAALREINENRLADKLQGHLPEGVHGSWEMSPRANDSGID